MTKIKRAAKCIINDWPVIAAILFLTVVGIWSLETCMEKTDAINRQAAQQCQRMFAESYR